MSERIFFFFKYLKQNTKFNFRVIENTFFLFDARIKSFNRKKNMGIGGAHRFSKMTNIKRKRRATNVLGLEQGTEEGGGYRGDNFEFECQNDNDNLVVFTP